MRLPVLTESPRLRYATFFYLYIMQGIPAGFALTAISNFLLGKNIPSEKVGTFIALVGLPWTVQFVWGPLIDRYQYSRIGHRKHWVVLSQWVAVLASLGLLLVREPSTQIPLLSLVFFVHSIFASIQVSSVDAMAITITPESQRGQINAYMRGGFLLGTSFGAAALSYVLHTQGFREAAAIQTVLLALFSLLFFFTKLNRTDPLIPGFGPQQPIDDGREQNPALTLVFRRVLQGITNPQSLYYFLLVAAIYFCLSVFIRSYTFHLINVLHWPDKTVSLLQGSWGSVITFVAIIFAGNTADRVGHKPMQVKVMWGVCLFLILLNASFWLWHFQVYSGAGLVLWNLADPLLSVAIFPILMGLCFKNVEGSQFTAYLALINLCDVAGSFLTGWLLRYVDAPVLGISCGFFLLTVLLLLKRKSNYAVIPG